MRLVRFSYYVCLALSVVAHLALACEASDDTDFPKSLALARQTQRPLLLAFLGRDWNLPSLKLDREVFDQAEFADNSKYNFILCKIHFYQTQERSPDILRQNQRLAETYHVDRFPTVVVLSAVGTEVGRFGYIEGGVEKFAEEVNRVLRGRQEHPPSSPLLH